MSFLICSKSRDQHNIRLFVQYLFFDEKHSFWYNVNFWYNKPHVNLIVFIGAYISSNILWHFLVKILYMLHREHCDTLLWIWSQSIFSKSLDFMLDLSFNFKKNLMHLIWAACKCVFSFLFMFEYLWEDIQSRQLKIHNIPEDIESTVTRFNLTKTSFFVDASIANNDRSLAIANRLEALFAKKTWELQNDRPFFTHTNERILKLPNLKDLVFF